MRGRGLPSLLRTENFAAATVRLEDTFNSFTRGLRLWLACFLSGGADMARHAHAASEGANILLGSVVSVLVSTYLPFAQCKPRGAGRPMRRLQWHGNIRQSRCALCEGFDKEDLLKAA